MTAPTHDYAVLASERVYDGAVIGVRRDLVSMPGGGSAYRDVVVHPGAVGVVAIDESDRVLLLRQYRHPVGRHLWELPAGLLDQAGEDPLAAARRELAEEAALAARDWWTLADTFTSPGMTDEAIRVYLARGTTTVESGFTRHDEEAELRPAWVPLDDALRRVSDGEIVNAMAVVGVLAAGRARATGFTGLRPADAPWSRAQVAP